VIGCVCVSLEQVLEKDSTQRAQRSERRGRSAEGAEENLRTIGFLGAADPNDGEKRARLNARLAAIVFEFPGWDGDEDFGN
jgi:hypothetical protein